MSFSFDIEQLKTLGTVRGLGRVGWDAMREFLLVEVTVGKPDGPLTTLPFAITEEAAAELQALLRLCLLEKEDESNTRQ